MEDVHLESKYFRASCNASGKIRGMDPNFSHHFRNQEGVIPLKSFPNIMNHDKTIEQVYGINKEYETCYLLSPSAIQKHRSKGHNFLHIGLVQIGVKPLTRRGLNRREKGQTQKGRKLHKLRIRRLGSETR